MSHEEFILVLQTRVREPKKPDEDIESGKRTIDR